MGDALGSPGLAVYNSKGKTSVTPFAHEAPLGRHVQLSPLKGEPEKSGL